MSEEKNRRGRPKGTGIDDRSQLQRVAALMAGDPDLKPTTAIKSIGVTDPSIIRRLRDKFHEARHELMADLTGGDTPTAPRDTLHPAATVLARDKARATATRSAPPETAARAMPARINSQAVRKSAAPADPAPAAPEAAEPAIAAPNTDTQQMTSARAKSEPAKATKALPPKQVATASASTKAAPAAPSSPPVAATHASADPASWLFTMCGFGIMAASAALEAQAAWATQFVRLPPMAMALRQHIALNELAMTLVTPSAVTRASFH